MNIAALYEIRRKIQDYFMKYEYILKPAGKFLLSLILLFIIKGDIGYNAILCNSLLLVIISLICALVPVGFISAIIGLVILGHLYRLSLESAVMGAVVLLLIFLDTAGHQAQHPLCPAGSGRPALRAHRRGSRGHRRAGDRLPGKDRGQ